MAEARAVRGLPLFFFGTLMDADVLARVLARPVAEAEFTPAVLPRHRRHAVVGRVYPVLRPAAAGSVAGLLFLPRSEDEWRRIEHFEAGEYAARPRRVQVGDRLTNALVFLELDGAFELSAAPWSLATWEEQHKAAYLLACDRWMADYVPDGLSAPGPRLPVSVARAGRTSRAG